MNTSNQSYKKLAIPYFREVFDLIDQAFRNQGIDYYLVGANAIALQILKEGSIRPPRGTKDIDFAIMVPTIASFDQVMNYLVSLGFVRAKDAANTLIYKAGAAVVDILPFGKIEEEFTERFDQRVIDLHVLGYSTILSDAEQIMIENQLVNVPPLPGMILLKLISYGDRPEERQNDLYDILYVIEHYYRIDEDEILSNHFDVIEKLSEFDQLLIAAEVLGRKSGKYLKINKKLKDRIFNFMESSIQEPEKSGMALDWTRRKDWDLSYTVAILESLFRGMKGALS